MAAHPTGLVVTAVSALVARGHRRADPPCHADERTLQTGTLDRSTNRPHALDSDAYIRTSGLAQTPEIRRYPTSEPPET
jgi:hypothetical protein